ncbi:ATP-binding protein [Lapillicoccus sp.]|uniref:ATP-binding protein n=1 Tax=Lapillicoccus sp. TaxID=1909287 RepID=UPI0025FBEB03|nr:ATP-binding protein [Lapillicoccus sp.]
MPTLRDRSVRPRLLDALGDTRIVVVQGARQVGKTTLVRSVLADRAGRFVTLDDDLTRGAAQADPPGFLRQMPDGLLAIDEVQRAPELVLALKMAVDDDSRPGRFLLTGSANLLRLPAMQDSLAGRAENIDLFGFSQGEIVDVREDFVDRLFAGEIYPEHRSDLSRADYLDRACAGGYPEALLRQPGQRRAAWYDNYVERITQRDAPDVSGLQRLSELPLLLRLLAARNATELVITNVSQEIGIPVRTLGPYLDLLETLFLVQRIPSWSTNLTKRVVTRPKVVLTDTGLTARLLNVSAEGGGVGANPELGGRLLEGFVAGELRRQVGWARENPRLSHFRDHNGAEVDFILETGDGRVAGIEVKARSTVTGRDARWLNLLRDRLGARFVAGVILHTGTSTAPFGDRIIATPIDALWATR